MSWDVQARRTHRHGSHVKARWRALGTIYDVSIDCPHGVHGASSEGLVRREMNSFSNAVDGYFQWDEDVERPFVILSWTDGGEQCQETLPLDSSHGHGIALSAGFRRVLGKRPHVPARLHGQHGQRADA